MESIKPTAALKLRRYALRAALYWIVPVLVALSALIFFWHLGEGSLSDWDKAIYAQVSKEMVQSGDWLTPHYGFQPLFHKPPLLMWCTAALYQLWGVNEFTARAASALSGVALIIVTYLTGKPPTPFFYSDRPILIARTSADLATFTADHQAKRIILAKEFLRGLGSYKVATVAERGSLIYATIKAES